MAKKNQTVQVQSKIITNTEIRVSLLSAIITASVFSLALSFAAFAIVTKNSADYKILVNSFKNLSNIQTVVLGLDFTMGPEKRNPNLKPLSSQVSNTSIGLTQADIDDLFEKLPTDFLIHFYINGDFNSLQAKSIKNIYSDMKIGGNVKTEGMSFSGDGEIRKWKDDLFVKINTLPSLGIQNYDAIKNKWIYIPPDGNSPIPELNTVTMAYDSNKNAQEYLAVMETAIEEKFITIQKSLPKVKEKNQNLNRYIVNFDFTKYANFVKKLETKLKRQILNKDDKWMEIMKDPKNLQFLKEYSKMQYIELFIDAQKNYLKKIVYSITFVPSNTIKKFQGKQARATITVSFDKINEKIFVARPIEYITLDEAQSLITGQPLNEILVNHQTNNIDITRSALSLYYAYSQHYPESLNELLQTKKQVGGSINSPELQLYSSVYLERPFLFALPKDVYTQEDYNYQKTADDYELIYQIQNIPKGYSSSIYYGRNVVEGVNTADSKNFSREARDLFSNDKSTVQ